MINIICGPKQRTASVIRYHWISLMLLAGCFSLGGCQNFIQKKITTEAHTVSALSIPPVVTAKSQAGPANAGAATTCQKELVSLATINPGDYDTRRRSFENLLHSVTEYKSVRQNINAQSRETMDSFYKFKMMRLCAEIELSLQRGLIGMEEKRSEF